MRYRNWTISPADPDDWGANFSFVADDFDGAPDSGTRTRCGSGKTLDECLDAIDTIDDDADPCEILVARIGVIKDQTMQLAVIFRNAARALGVE